MTFRRVIFGERSRHIICIIILFLVKYLLSKTFIKMPNKKFWASPPSLCQWSSALCCYCFRMCCCLFVLLLLSTICIICSAFWVKEPLALVQLYTYTQSYQHFPIATRCCAHSERSQNLPIMSWTWKLVPLSSHHERERNEHIREISGKG